MKIHSKFKDYYDTVAFQNGAEEDPREKHFIRNTTEHSITADQQSKYITRWAMTESAGSDQLSRMFGGRHMELTTGRRSGNRFSDNIVVSGFVVFFAGKRYPGVRVRLADWYMASTKSPADRIKYAEFVEPRYIYDVHTLNEFAIKYNADLRSTNWWTLSKKDKTKGEASVFFDHLGLDPEPSGLREYMIDNKLSIVIVDLDYGCSHNMFVNPQLSKWDFSKRMDPFTAYQDLTMWVEGTLAEPDDPEPLADKIRIQQHGFDVVTSFRNMK